MKSPTLSNVIIGDRGLAEAFGMSYHATRQARWRGLLRLEPIGKIGATSIYDQKQAKLAIQAYRREHRERSPKS